MTGYRIAISGAAGIGKTTLARALAGELKLPYISEGLGPVLTAMNLLAKAQLNGKEEARAATEGYLEACQQWLRERHIAMQSHVGGFVVDRWAIDIMVRWLFARIQSHNDALYHQLARHVHAMSRLIDVVVVPPLLIATVGDMNDEGLKRRKIWSQRLHSQALLRGLLDQLAPVDRIYLPPREMTVEERVSTVLGILRGKLETTDNIGRGVL